MSTIDKKRVQDRLYMYTSQILPAKLLDAMIKEISNYNVIYTDSMGRLGVLGVNKEVSEKHEHKHVAMLDYKTCLLVGSAEFESVVKQVRRNFPEMDIDSWYLLSMSIYYSGSKIPEEIDFEKYKLRNVKGFEFATNVWMSFKSNGGSIT